ncbi:hypothetical protein VTL71DRAFT_7042 [Oculimacula yallundae]|uniref:Secreted protein n=1 Tax=Oculimacula yallundae TaxID=86028 RepID=A0ABR4BVM0_9HELO
MPFVAVGWLLWGLPCSVPVVDIWHDVKNILPLKCGNNVIDCSKSVENDAHKTAVRESVNEEIRLTSHTSSLVSEQITTPCRRK